MIQSGTFWLLLAVSVSVFWLLPRWLRMGFLAAVSFGYLAWLAPTTALTLLAWSLLFYWLAPLALTANRSIASKAAVSKAETRAVETRSATQSAVLEYAAPPPSRRRWVLAILILSILAYLACFKYILPLLAPTSSVRRGSRILAPLGISYFTFKFVHYAVETARGNIRDRSLPRFLCYIYLFPIFTAGPIERLDHFLGNLEDDWRLDSMIQGLTRIVHGLIKKFFFAEMALKAFSAQAIEDLFRTVSRASAIPTWRLWMLGMGAYLWLYMDFAGYSDIAIGASRLFGIRIMENFDWPILAPNINVFWKRWHMTLAGWCQSYIYMPVLGLTRSPYLALYSTFVAIGLWHEGRLPYLFWGAYHATGIAVWQAWTRLKRRRKWIALDRGLWRYAGVPLTFLFVSVGEICTHAGIHRGNDTLRVLAKLFCIRLAF